MPVVQPVDREVLARVPERAVVDRVDLPDGTLAVLFRASPRSESPDYHQLLQLGRDGEVIAERTYHLSYPIGGIAFLDSTVGMQMTESSAASPRWFFPIAAGAPREPPRLDLASLPVCSARARSSGIDAIIVEDARPERSARVYLGNDGQRCVQAVELRDPERDGRDVFAAASSAGDLRARFDLQGAGRVRELRCALAAQLDRDSSVLASPDIEEARYPSD